MGLRFDPIGGGQFKQAVQQIIEAERQPIKNLETRKAREESKMKLFGEFKGKFAGFDKALAEFTDLRKFREYKVDLGDGENLVSVNVDKNVAQPGSYKIQVNQLAERTSVISNSFADPSEASLGSGYIVLYGPQGKEEVYVSKADASLNGIARLINDQKNATIRASVIKDMANPDEPYRLILTAKADGVDDEIEFPDFYLLDGKRDLHVEQSKEAKNARLLVDGFEMEGEGNQIPDFLQGVTLNLKQADPNRPFTLTITEDTQKISGKVKGLVDTINGVLEFINLQNKVDEKSDTRATFAGDTSLQTIEYRLRNMLHEGFPVWDNPDSPDKPRFIFLNEIGIQFGKEGKLNFSEEKFQKAIERDFNGVAEGITGEYGFASQLKSVIQNYNQPGSGMLSVREQTMRNRIRRIDDEIAGKEKRLEQRAQAVTAQFSRLQSSLASLQQQQAYLQSSMGGGGGNNLVQQLLGG